VNDLSLGEAVDGLMVFTIGPVLGATMCPGFLLCVPGFLLLVLPLLALAALAAVVAAVLMTPYLLVRSLRGSVRSMAGAAKRRS
jgi:hypothetical protein